jgi:Ca-activated chloride channel family protein
VETGSGITAPEAFETMSNNMAFASAVAEFGLLLSDSEYKADAALDGIIDRAMAKRGEDAFGYRAEFVQLLALTNLLADQ